MAKYDEARRLRRAVKTLCATGSENSRGQLVCCNPAWLETVAGNLDLPRSVAAPRGLLERLALGYEGGDGPYTLAEWAEELAELRAAENVAA